MLTSTKVSQRYKKALDFGVPAVTSRYMEKHGIPKEIAELHERECKRYLVLCSLFPGQGLGMRGPVDEYWHTFLLFTKEYQSFCEQVAGFFIHHTPNVNKDSESPQRNSFHRTMEQYVSVFRESPDERAWPDYRTSLNAECDPCGQPGCTSDPAPGPPECAATPSCDN